MSFIIVEGNAVAKQSLSDLQKIKEVISFDGFKISVTVPLHDAAKVWKIAEKFNLQRFVSNIDKKQGKALIVVRSEETEKLEEFIKALPKKNSIKLEVSSISYNSLSTETLLEANDKINSR